MKKEKHAKALLQKAFDDLRALEGMLDSAIFSNEIFGFHAQQAVEKALKALIDLLGFEYPQTHDLNVLFRILREKDVSIEGKSYFINLNLYAVLFRYVDTPGKIRPIDRTKTVGKITELLNSVVGYFKH